MTFTDEELMAYADGELDEARRQQIQGAISRDPEVARRVDAHRALRDSLRASFDPVLGEPVPDRLVAMARSRADTKSNVVPLRGHRVPVRSRPGWIALAASFVLGALALQMGQHFLYSPVYTARGQILIPGDLQQALSNQLASTEAPQTGLTIGVSFLSKSGQYCRTFTLQSLAGLACNDAGDWKVQVLARTGASGTEYRQAGSNIPPAILQAVTDTIAGGPLDAKDEANARAQKWQHSK
ncbi:MAG: hypothetical protein JSR66_33585 [Proteobacteria bacterium]|nr:hypothetical protein [Pseudomonadota bacterium]